MKESQYKSLFDYQVHLESARRSSEASVNTTWLLKSVAQTNNKD